MATEIALDSGPSEDKVDLSLPREKASPVQNHLRSKRLSITHACRDNDLDKLIALATSTNGLIDDSLRRVAWPILLGCNPQDAEKAASDSPEANNLNPHRDEDQVQLDVNRAFVYYPQRQSDTAIAANKARLLHLIVLILRRHPSLCYFQGYHDIAQVLLLVLGEDNAVDAMARVSLLRIRDYMLPSLSPALKHLRLLPPILQRADPLLARHLSQTNPYFALSATLTLYAHDIEAYSDIARLYDFILAHEPVLTLYVFAAIILSRRKELLDVPSDEPEMQHFVLSKLPKSLDLEELIARALVLFQQHPPQNLPGFIWWRLSSLSVLKTSRSITKQQTLEQGEDLLRRQARQLRREELQQNALMLVYKYRRPIVSVAATVLVGALSFWLRRAGHDKVLWSYIIAAKQQLTTAHSSSTFRLLYATPTGAA